VILANAEHHEHIRNLAKAPHLERRRRRRRVRDFRFGPGIES
jgi:hypothetical protein